MERHSTGRKGLHETGYCGSALTNRDGLRQSIERPRELSSHYPDVQIHAPAKRAQQLWLHVQADISNFIQKEGSAIGQLESACLLREGACERAPFVSKIVRSPRGQKVWPRNSGERNSDRDAD